MLYQQDINLNAKNFKVEAWKKCHISLVAQFSTLLPLSIETQGGVDENGTVYKTKLIETEYNHSYEIYMNQEGLDIQASTLATPTDDTMNVYNTTDSLVDDVVLKDSKPHPHSLK